MKNTERGAILLALAVAVLLLWGCGQNPSSPQTANEPALSPTENSGTSVNTPQDQVTQQENQNPALVVEKCPAQSHEQVWLGQEAGEDDIIVSFKKGDSDTFEVTLKINTQWYVFGYGFYLAYDPLVLKYARYQHGDNAFLGNNTNILITEMASDIGAARMVFSGCKKQPGKQVVVVSESRGGWSTIGARGKGILITLKFSILTHQETTNLVFEENKIFEKEWAGNTPMERDISPKYLSLNL